MIDTVNFIVRPIPFRDPVDAFAPLAGAPFACLLAGERGGPQSRFAYIAADPFDVIAVKPGNTPSDPFADLRKALNAYRAQSSALPAPFAGGAVGFVGYEINGALERLPPRKSPAFPFDLAFGLYDTVAVFDLLERKAWVVSSGLPETSTQTRATRATERAKQFEKNLGQSPLSEIPAAVETTWTAELSELAYRNAVERIIAYIRAGEIYQSNFTQRWRAPYPNTLLPFDLYRRLRNQSAAPFSAYLSFDSQTQIISVSPERFLNVDAAGQVETRPIKGTRPRGATPDEDRALAAELRASPKDRAENLMIVDLLRNDLSRVCRAGSVDVPMLCGLESFPSVHHLVSAVTGRLRPECSAVDLLEACFPGGSVTGAPKIRAMEIIHELEPVARGPYCGTVAWLGWDGAMDSSIVIRTLIRSGDQLFAQAGGGIVADSDPTQEYDESVLKATPLLRALNGHGRFTCASA